MFILSSWECLRFYYGNLSSFLWGGGAGGGKAVVHCKASVATPPPPPPPGSRTASVATPSSPHGKTFSAESDQELLLVSFSIVVTNVSYHRALCLHTCAHFLAVAQNIWFRTGEN